MIEAHEVTSVVDVHADRSIQRIIREEFAGCMVIASAHRLDSNLGFDTVAVFEKWRLLDVGPPKWLPERNIAFKVLHQSG